ncbi:hypothetical protein GHT89_16610 [Acinetobacter baumannii]|uniref:hypothetical protein n=1 Tax=Acinetobacter baumannii TaxID=470 RepID=UPI00387DC935
MQKNKSEKLSEVEIEAIYWLQRSLVTIRSLALRGQKEPNKAEDILKAIYDISDACHNVPYCFDGKNSSLSVETELKLMKSALSPVDESQKFRDSDVFQEHVATARTFDNRN